MGGLFDGLEKLGLRKAKEKEAALFNADRQKKKETEQVKVKQEMKEEDFLFQKKYCCPICQNQFTEHTVKSGKARRIGSDLDLRPRYLGIDATKYNVVVCKKCGYAAAPSAFPHISPLQRKILKEEIQKYYTGMREGGNTITYEEAIIRFKLALYCSISKHSYISEQAYLCLQAAWMYRGYVEELEQAGNADSQKIENLQKLEAQYIQKAHTGFEAAVANELFPICGMDEMTFNYLLAALSRAVGNIEECRKLLGAILIAKGASPVVKERARRLKDIVAEERNA